ncbi:MAG TPA: cytochrome d ubiquinol oxidase subunit II [Streptosporangiaceae bacterium]|jgi:cytochrome d ubiquinol oxidase subunit II
MIADTVGGILLAAITLYALLGGADFGGGLWDLLAGGASRGRRPRALIEESITPVWEANHVWLVFALVIFWTAFPDAFTAVMTTLALPIWLAVLGIVLRGVGFAFRKEVHGLSLQRLFGATFALSSLLTPFFMGAVIGGIAAGRVPAGGAAASLAAWTQPVSVLTGLLFTGACGYLAAVYLTGEAARRGDDRMRGYFTRRAQASGAVTGALSLATLAVLDGSDTGLAHRLTGRGLPLVIVTALTGLAVLILLTAGRVRGARVLAGLGVAAVVWGWGVAQYPALLPGTAVTLADAGAPHATLAAIVVLFAALVLLIGPSFVLLFALQHRQILAGGEALAGTAAPARAVSPAVAGTPRRAGSGAPGRPGAGSRLAAFALVVLGAIVRRRGR